MVEQLLHAFTTPGDLITFLDTTEASAAPQRAEPDQDGVEPRLDVALRLARRLGRIAHLAPPMPHLSTGAPAVPYWDGLLDTTTGPQPAPIPPHGLGNAADAGTAAVSTDSGPVGHQADLVVATVHPGGTDSRLGAIAASLLRAGGIVIVLTHSHQHCGRLVDPTGTIVASCQQADLLYLQHIIALHTQPTTDTAPPADRPTPRHVPAHSDVLVFAQPVSHTERSEAGQ